MLTEIREAVATYLGGLDYFNAAPAIPVYTEKLKTLENDLQKGIANFGISVLVTTVVARDAQNQIPKRLDFKKIGVVVHVLENPKLNLKSNVSASDLAEVIAWHCRKFAPLGDAVLELKDIILGEHPTLLVYHIIFSMEGSMLTPPVRPAPNP